ncbi:peroxiredoxin [Prochlorococcus marinus]|uniref:thioredoxin-dependent peroxiredoxin n=1 Tax=Prochlorococcus marinus (strain MIT 9303) TaxID=59922 RepID=A2CAY3_PROM3|nr:peroxiredoxin [Prochlorococcus marinus]ABM78643.1 putative bacterioferritin comigratory protein [Prochlorococcus marinus str. MIT 9303]
MALQVGDKAPAIDLVDQNGKKRRSNDLKGKVLVLFFYPKDDTPGCTAEACSFRDNYSVFEKLGSEVWGVSGDDDISHRQFAERHSLPYALLSDKDNTLRRAFEVPRTLGMLPSRVTYVIDGQGTIRHIFNNLLDGPAHMREACRVVEEIKKKR